MRNKRYWLNMSTLKGVSERERERYRGTYLNQYRVRVMTMFLCMQYRNTLDCRM